jgi:hypothetical protein
MSNKPLGSMKRGEFLLAEELLASKDGLCSLELLSYACF